MVSGGKPATTNLLPNDERVRLMRSVRKVGAVMGTPPLLVELRHMSEPPELHIISRGEASMDSIVLHELREKSSRTSQRSSKREGVVFSVSHSSTSSLDYAGKTGPSQRPLRVPPPAAAKLSLSQDARSSLNSVTRLRLVLTLTQPSSSTTPYPYPHHHPHDSTDSIDTLMRSLSVLIAASPPSTPDKAARRRKMVKLVNMLGGPIPPALVFPPSPPKNTQTANSRGSRRRSRSVPPSRPPPSSAGAATAAASPRKLVRPRHSQELALPTLTVDLISHPRPLAAHPRTRSGSSRPSTGTGTTSTSASGPRGRAPPPRSVTPSYNLRRKSEHTSES
ncbi:hypothetical protein B0H11DRAFT_2107274 [Mycena galericulata]|nr:hypothetical protein B0H11DRAFT_2116062 [Mycena galericulata]KAJ7437469.1 hypothetical protein B0H11DRAFT_2107274 [Mycena galericulata]